MKYVIFSDIHGNYIALEKMLEETRGLYDGYIFCGDIIGYFNHCDRVIKILRNIKNLIAVKGNHENYYLNRAAIDKDLVGSYGESYNINLEKDNLKYIIGLPNKLYLKIDGLTICIIHGKPNDVLEGRCYPDSIIDYQYDSDITFCGHTHYRMVRCINNHKIINPGSLGQPRDGQGFSYATYDFLNSNLEFKNVCLNRNEINELLKNENNNDLKQYLIGRSI